MMSLILGIESSCDDSAAAVVQCEQTPKVLSSIVHGQSNLHAAFGGVVPELAARAHAEILDHCVEEALEQANRSLADLDAIAVTAGPGLIGGVLSGVMLAKGLSLSTGLPLVGVNHLAGHALSPQIEAEAPFPYLMLLVSGGHCQFLIAHGPTRFERLGGTIDDAPGEAFDKVARLLGLPQPGGPEIEKLAETGQADAFALPRPMLDRDGLDMSFSGLKTAVRRMRDQYVTDHGGLRADIQANLAASFQQAVADILAEKTRRALRVYLSLTPHAPTIAVAGGVAANSVLRRALDGVAQDNGVAFVAPPQWLCTDNAAMIAYAGGRAFQAGHQDDLTLTARPRWPLDADATPLVGSGRKGPKA